MALTDKQKATIQAALQKKIRGSCPMCSVSSWVMQDELVAATTTTLGGSIAIGGPFVPMIQLVCSNCGFVAHHAAGALGIKLQ